MICSICSNRLASVDSATKQRAASSVSSKSISNGTTANRLRLPKVIRGRAPIVVAASMHNSLRRQCSASPMGHQRQFPVDRRRSASRSTALQSWESFAWQAELAATDETQIKRGFAEMSRRDRDVCR